MVSREEIKRELSILKEAGIGGVEINPIEFPHRIDNDDMGLESYRWLSDKWIDLLSYTFEEAKKQGIICDLIVGSGWPFGAETLAPEERAEVLLLNVDHIDGPCIFEKPRQEILDAIDPKVSVPCPDREFKIISMHLVPDPINSTDQAIDISEKSNDNLISIEVPVGKHALYSLVRVTSFASVINGAPGAAGPILDHMNKDAVTKYLNKMSSGIESECGPLSNHLRALFTDSMELEGCNWCSDFPEEFKLRRGYDIMPWLPFIMFKVGRLGGVINDKYGVKKTNSFEEETARVRFDFEYTKAELLYERFTLTYLDWCKELGVKSRAQAYGRGFFPLRTSLGYDIPEGESWTTNWLKHKVGEEMPDSDYRRGRAYTMINKYVSSAAHLSGKRVVSCEEMTNTYMVFNTSLERLKNGSDQSIISGITHSVWHGFNYSPPNAPYPGWVQYGSYLNEQNNWWPYFNLLNKYKARISAVLQNSDMYSDIAILPANYDLWSTMGVQTDPFPEKLNVTYTSLLWEAICKNGGASDYISEDIIKNSEIRKGKLCYGNKEFATIFLPGVESIIPESLEKLLSFVKGGGKLFCIDVLPSKSPGLKNYQERDSEVLSLVTKMNNYPDNFILLSLPKDISFLEWYSKLLKEYSLSHYLDIEKPDQWLMQIRCQGPEESEILFISNSNIHKEHSSRIKINSELVSKRSAWVWNPETGNKRSLYLDNDNSFILKLGPAESILIVFDYSTDDDTLKEQKPLAKKVSEITASWNLDFIHCRNDKFNSLTLNTLKDLSQLEEYKYFSGKIIYKCTLDIEANLANYMELKQVFDIAELKINGVNCGLSWYGNRIYDISKAIRVGKNSVEIIVTTLMGNYMKSLTNNPNAQYWTNEKRKNQDLTPLGLGGPVVLLV